MRRLATTLDTTASVPATVRQTSVAHPGARSRTYWRPLVGLLLTLPLTAYAVGESVAWFRAPFPGFFVMVNAIVPTIGGVDWPPDRATLFHSQVIAVDGTPVSTSAEVYRYAAQQPVGTPITYRLRRRGAITERTIPTRAFRVIDYVQTHGVLLLFGIICSASGIIVGFLQPRLRAAQVYFVQALVTGTYAISAVFLHRPGFPILGNLCPILEAFFGATWIHLSLVFPIERGLAVRRRLLGVAYSIATIDAALVLYGLHRQPPYLTPLYFTYLYNSAAIALFVMSLVLGYRATEDLLPRLRVKAILAGAIICLPWPILAFIDNAVSGRAIPIQLALLLTPFGYVGLGYAIVKHDLFDIDRVVRRSFVYVLLSLIVIGAYALLLEMPGRFVPGIADDSRTVIGMVFVLVLAIALEPLRRFLQSVVDRAFYRGRLDYRATIRALSATMTSFLNLHELVAQITHQVAAALQLECAAVCLVDAQGKGVAFVHDVIEGAPIRQTTEPAVVTLTRLVETAPNEFDANLLLRLAPDADTRQALQHLLRRLHAQVIVPLILRGHAIGLLSFSRKRSGQPFDSEAIELLRTLADQTAIAVQNAQSLQALEALNRDLDGQVQTRTAELSRAYDDLKSAQTQLVQSEKMASLGQLVAGVAHELNNPASFVYGGLENLGRRVSAVLQLLQAYERLPIADAAARAAIDDTRRRTRIDACLEDIPNLLRISAEGSERIKKIVDDLRLFARADTGERLSTDVTEGLESSLRLLAGRATAAAVKVTTDYGTVPRVAANGAQLNQVWINLLVNALDAVQDVGGAQVNVAVASRADGHGTAGVEVRITDNGAGIEPAHLSRVFEPFFTTKPIGQGTGLGLSIAYGAVKAHGGTITIDSHPGTGTTVTVWLPQAVAAR